MAHSVLKGHTAINEFVGKTVETIEIERREIVRDVYDGQTHETFEKVFNFETTIIRFTDGSLFQMKGLPISEYRLTPDKVSTIAA